MVIEALLQRETVAGGVPSVVLHPGHISGPWPSITPAGNLDLDVWRRLAARVSPCPCPGSGSACCTTCTATTSRRPSSARSPAPRRSGSSFHVVSEQAMTLRGLAAGVAAWFGREAGAGVRGMGRVRAPRRRRPRQATRVYVARSIAACIDLAREVLGYRPRFSSLDALHESLRWLADNGHVDLGGQKPARRARGRGVA